MSEPTAEEHHQKRVRDLLWQIELAAVAAVALLAVACVLLWKIYDTLQP